MNWTHGEPGPKCFCGKETYVTVDDDEVLLWCLFHSSAEGMYFSLPHERPEKWPNMTNAEMVELIKDSK